MSVGNPVNKSVSCVILDLDGTLLNTGTTFITHIIGISFLDFMFYVPETQICSISLCYTLVLLKWITDLV